MYRNIWSTSRCCGGFLKQSNRLISYHNSLSHQVNSFTQQIKAPKTNAKGLFGNQLLSNWNGFYLFRQNAIIEAEGLVQEAISPSRNRKMVQVFDELSNCLCKVADLSEFVRIGHPDRNYANAAEQSSIAINAEVERLNTNRALYNALLQTTTQGDVVPTTAGDDYVSKLFLFDFEQSGIHLNEDLRKEVVHLNEHILQVGSYFMQGTAQPRVVISGLHNDSNDPKLREFAFKQFLRFEDHQEQLLLELIYSRLKLSRICGFQSFAHRAINGSIAETPEFVWELINTVNNMVRSKSELDFTHMLALKQNESFEHCGVLKQWDIPYYTQSHKVKRFSEDIKSANPYFSLGSCMEGLDMILNSIFNIRLEICDTNEEDLWHPNVMKIAVRDLSNEKLLGYIYGDFFIRSKKPFHDCDYQLPIVVVFLNFPNATSSYPTLLSPSMVDNLFHEMGHAIHSMLARTPYQHVTGTRCSTDLAEVPSILMENFASDPRVVGKFAKHFANGKPIDEKLLHNWIDSKTIFAASDLQLQIFYSALDQVYHSDNPLKSCRNTTEVLNKIQDQYYGIGNTSGTSWQLRFGHLVGYGAKYYSYLVSKAVSSSIWDKLFERDPLSSSAGSFYRQEVLAHGGGKPPKEIVESVLGHEVTANFLANSLVNNIDQHYLKSSKLDQ
ncbi:hypothetical protein RDWZM_006799 [Blomia tropicalis]|uniref:Peptidase M3A/M3B catalytic domain-containing protein n=1 Tax=Blomia tropicalis TaxID=40697 RepID=A0A9Q0M8H4_BLOTA|nr:hypothetical protein RDWZM_006799 [Blomia tropicalis]